jgi:pimeloyl-ACP methyl ester carboxylesterase
VKKLDADLRFYTTFDAIQDLDEIRAALGFDKINLWGGSYGTRFALTYMQKYPTHVRSAILDGVAPYANKLSLYMAHDAQRALSMMFDACQRDAACRGAFPDLEVALSRVLSSLRDAPVRSTYRHPRTGNKEEVLITADAFGALLRSALYIPEYTSLLPSVISHAAEGDFSPLLALGVLVGDLFIGLFPGVFCVVTKTKRERDCFPGGDEALNRNLIHTECRPR